MLLKSKVTATIRRICGVRFNRLRNASVKAQLTVTAAYLTVGILN